MRERPQMTRRASLQFVGVQIDRDLMGWTITMYLNRENVCGISN